MTNNKNQGMGIVGAALAGAAIGAAAVVLSDKQKREQIMDKAEEVKKKAKGKLAEIASDVEGVKEQAKKDLSKSLKQTDKKLTQNGSR